MLAACKTNQKVITEYIQIHLHRTIEMYSWPSSRLNKIDFSSSGACGICKWFLGVFSTIISQARRKGIEKGVVYQLDHSNSSKTITTKNHCLLSKNSFRITTFYFLLSRLYHDIVCLLLYEINKAAQKAFIEKTHC